MFDPDNYIYIYVRVRGYQWSLAATSLTAIELYTYICMLNYLLIFTSG